MDAALSLLFLKSIVIGFSIAAPVGPIGLLCIQRTLEHGPRIGLATGFGAVVADGLYGAIGAFGVSGLMSLMLEAKTWLSVGGAVFLLWLAWTTWRAAETQQAAGVPLKSINTGNAFGGTFLLTMSNPATILSFIAVFSVLAGGAPISSPGWMVAGVVLGSALWWLVLVGVVARLRRRVAPRHIRMIRRAAAVALAGFAVLQLLTV